MMISTIGLDLAKLWFQVHGVDATGHVAVRRRLRRSEVLAYFRSLEPCLVGMEACATAHYWPEVMKRPNFPHKRTNAEHHAAWLSSVGAGLSGLNPSVFFVMLFSAPQM